MINLFGILLGRIGPYYVNTHFVYGNEDDANELLKFIDSMLDKKVELPKAVFEKVMNQYNVNQIYNDIINETIDYIKSNIDVEEIDYIAGGERRDWLFSFIVAYILKKPHLTLFKDLSAVSSNFDFSETKVASNLGGKKILHIADLMNFGTSYIRSWIPAIQDLNGELVWSLVLVDRMQGGKKRLEDLGIKSFAITNIDTSLFKLALEKGVINEAQFNMIEKYIEDPDSTMRNFLLDHPNFLQDALNSDEKTAKRAKLLIDGNLYDLN